MDAKTKNKLVNALMNRFIKLYEDKYGVKPKFNRNTAKWGFEYFLEDVGAEAQDTLDYYFTLDRPNGHSSQEFLRNYDDYNKWMIEDAEDAEYRRQLRLKTKQKVEEFEQKWQPPST